MPPRTFPASGLLRIAASVPVFELNALSIDVPELSQPLHEAIGARPRIVEVFRVARVQHGDPGRPAMGCPAAPSGATTMPPATRSAAASTKPRVERPATRRRI